MRYDSFSSSNSISSAHAENQDSYLTDGANLLFAVADGVGGYDGGKEASSLAVELLESDAARVVDEMTLSETLLEIHNEIIKRSRRLGFPSMGTTVACAKVFPDRALVGNVGDSPVLLFRGEEITALYHDDSYRSEDPSSMFGMVQYLGVDFDIEVHTRNLLYSSGDVLLLCSDGVTDNLSRAKLQDLIKMGSAEKIVQAAVNEKIKPDDMTAVLVFL